MLKILFNLHTIKRRIYLTFICDIHLWINVEISQFYHDSYSLSLGVGDIVIRKIGPVSTQFNPWFPDEIDQYFSENEGS